ncbi:MAG TPA: hypothetical protein VGB50_11755 [Flavobacterium sp.]|jgi:hypothetical protein
MKAINNFLFAAGALLALTACDDIIEQDISDDTVYIVSPLDGAEIESNVVPLQWSGLTGADKYRVQIYSNQAIVLDSTVTATHLTCPLSQGNYQWRVRGENSAYVSAYSFTMSFHMMESEDLENQQVLLSSPSANLYTKNHQLICTWDALDAADSYTFELVNITAGGIVVHQEPGITGTSFELTEEYLTEDAQYQWKVKAVNGTGSTNFSTRMFYLDSTAPAASVNTVPLNNSVQISGTQVDFGWTVAPDSGTITSPVKYVVEVSNEVNFSSLLLASSMLSTNSYSNTFNTAGNYFWRVRTTDLAGNESVASAVFKFTIN